MTLRRIIDSIAAEPFQSFRIKMASGETYDVRYPVMIAVGRMTAHVLTSRVFDDETTDDHQHELSIIRIESVEPLDTMVKQHSHQNDSP